MIGGVLGMGRKLAEARMTDQCRVTRPGPKVWDEAAGQNVHLPVTVYEGPCRVKHPTVAAAEVDAGSQLLTVSALQVHFPVDAVEVRSGDAVEITTSPTRPAETGRKFRVVSEFDGSQTTALRFRVEAFDGR